MMRVYIDRTPNPDILEFVCEEGFTSESYEYSKNSKPNVSPLADELLNLPYVEKVYMTNNIVAVHKNNETEWAGIANELKEIINTHLVNKTILENYDTGKKFKARSESTEDPDTLVFITNQLIMSGRLVAQNQEEARENPLAQTLLKFGYVKSVSISGNSVTVTKFPEINWRDVKADLTHFIPDFLEKAG